MQDPPQRNRRRIKLIKPRFQFKLIGIFVGISAVGFLMAPVAYEIVRSHYQILSRLDPASVDAVLGEMSAEATRVVRGAAPGAAIEERRSKGLFQCCNMLGRGWLRQV